MLRRLRSTYKIQTRPEDGLDEVLVEFVPWQNSIFNIVCISRAYWADDFCPQYKTQYYCLDDFNETQQETLKKILIEEYSLFVGYMRCPFNDVAETGFLKDSTLHRKYDARR